jgi:probable F420-dependent oxidoreductase
MGGGVRFGFMYYGDRTMDPAHIVDLAGHVEALGFESFWVPEHQALYPRAAVEMARFGLALDYTRPHPDALQVLGLVAAVTERITLEAFLILPCHHPVVLAKQLATLDVLSRGRARLCVGVGDLPRELEACGVDFPSRGRVADECIDVLRALWSCDRRGASYAGEFFTLRNMVSYPQPYGRPAIPIDVGGASRAAMRRAGQRGDGFYPSYSQSHDEFVAGLDTVRALAAGAGRDPGSIVFSRTIWLGETPADQIDEAIALGVRRFVCMAKMADPAEVKDHLATLAHARGLAAPAAPAGPA